MSQLSSSVGSVSVKRQPNFSTDEMEALTASVSKHNKVLFGRLGGVMSTVSKEATWKEVAKDVSAVGVVVRSAAEVKKKWVCLKSASKAKAVALKKEGKQTGGGPKTVPDLSELETTVVGLIGESAVSGVPGGFDLNSYLVGKLTGIF